MKSLNKYLTEKLLVNKDYKKGDDFPFNELDKLIANNWTISNANVWHGHAIDISTMMYDLLYESFKKYVNNTTDVAKDINIQYINKGYPIKMSAHSYRTAMCIYRTIDFSENAIKQLINIINENDFDIISPKINLSSEIANSIKLIVHESNKCIYIAVATINDGGNCVDSILGIIFISKHV